MNVAGLFIDFYISIPWGLFIIGIDVRNQVTRFAYGKFNMICSNLFRIHIRPPDKVIAEICMRVQFLVCTDYTPKIKKLTKHLKNLEIVIVLTKTEFMEDNGIGLLSVASWAEIKGASTTPWCCPMPLVTDFIVVRQPQAPMSCIAFGFYRCPPASSPYVLHQIGF